MNERARYERLQLVFQKVHAIEDADERTAFVERECADDPSLRDEALELLRIGREEPLLGDLRDTEIHKRRHHVEALLDAGEGGPVIRRIGAYEIKDEIGRGGMGLVYEAEQASPRRRVAIKIVSPAAVTASLMRRFEYESEILGRLQHPGVAQIYEAGTCDLGSGPQPYFAMEYVEGETIVSYCDSHRLGTRERLELIARVCEAVQHAHERGVIHRDLKPGNILVTAEGQPKVLDFGVARATDTDVQTVMTEAGALVGTVPYMSPEQASGNASLVDTRSDVYALGVLAYQLLTGRMPYDLSKKLVHEAVRVIVEDEPTSMSSVNRSLRGDIETIVGKALEKEPERRYESAAALAADLRRHLRDEPIVAHPPSAAYQFRKFARRNKGVVWGAAAVVVALIAGTVVSTVFGVQAERARAEAIVALAERDAALEVEQLRNDDLESANQFLYRMLHSLNTTDIGATITTTVNEMIHDPFESQLSEFERMSFESTLGRVFDRPRQLELGRVVMKDLLLNHVAPRMEIWLEDRPRSRPMLELALTRHLLSLGYNEEAVVHARRALSQFDGSMQGDARYRSRAVADLVFSLSMLGRFDEIEEVLQDVDLSVLEELDILNRLEVVESIGTYHYENQEYELALRYTRETLRLALEHPDRVDATRFRQALATTLRRLGRDGEAEPLYLDIIADHTTRDDPRLGVLAVARANYSKLLLDQSRLEEAEHQAREGYRLLGDTYGTGSYPEANGRAKLADVLSLRGRHQEAIDEFSEAYSDYLGTLGPEHRRTLELAGRIADAYLRWDRDEPGAGHGASAEEWRAKGEGQPVTQP